METLTRLVAESLARHGFDRPVDFRRLQWSRWFRCESHHSLLVVPSKPGVFALAEEIMDISATTEHVGTAASAVQRNRSAAKGSAYTITARVGTDPWVGPAILSEEKGSGPLPEARSQEPQAEPRRMLAVTQFLEDDDMAFVLDRMLSRENPMRARLASGRYFVRYVVIEDAAQRRSICTALNQWIVSSAEKATGIGPHFASSQELAPIAEPTPVGTAASPALSVVEGAVQQTLSEAKGSGTGISISTSKQSDERAVNTAPALNSAIATNIHCSSSFPSGF